jgi:pseudaminic acid biosynthesis-associated methylase
MSTRTPESEMTAEASRLERLWGEDFGDAYVERNRAAGEKRAGFWSKILELTHPQRVLEVGCNLGGNLRWIAEAVEPQRVYGIDVNLAALKAAHVALPAVNAIYSAARELPFRDRFFDLTFTMGVLIHQPEATLPLVMSELVRTSRRYVLCGEYFSETTVEVPYRGQTGALFKRNYGKLYTELFSDLRVVKDGHLTAAEGFDDVTWWLLEKIG